MRDSKSRHIDGKEMRPESLMMSYGYAPRLSEGAVKPPIFQTSTVVFETAEAGKAFFEVAYGLRTPDKSEQLGLIYSRINNPDLEVLEDRLTLWDDAEACAAFESGMAAITTTLFTFVRPGDIVVHSEPLYGGSEHFLHHILPEFGVTPVGFPAGRPVNDVAESIRERTAGGRVSAVLIETPANPTNALVDIAGVVELVESLNGGDPKPIVMVDNTFLGPLWQHPLQHGADIVLYSATKFIGGHSDVIAGACLGRAELLNQVHSFVKILCIFQPDYVCNIKQEIISYQERLFIIPV